jgi:hypothetical protein
MKETIKVKDKLFEPMVREEEIMAAVDDIARRINSDYSGKEPVFLCVLNLCCGSSEEDQPALQGIVHQIRILFGHPIDAAYPEPDRVE